jgi:hypothetical protein
MYAMRDVQLLLMSLSSNDTRSKWQTFIQLLAVLV